MRHLLLVAVLAARCFVVVAAADPAAAVPPGFTRATVTSALNAPTAMAVAPDGRIFVTEQGGKLRVITKTRQLLATPFVSLSVDSNGERGLLGVALSPNFANNHWLYVYWTVPGSPPHNRITRFTANGNVAVAGSGRTIMTLDALSSATNHNGGAIHFSPGGYLYIGVGDNANGLNSQNMSNRLGKLLRIRPDGSIPSDNPFYAKASGANRAIYSTGLRNPYTFAFQRTTRRSFINDVGQSSWEEINDSIKGANYGWPDCEGSVGCDADATLPYYRYPHSGGTPSGCAITGGVFYNPVKRNFPTGYVSDYFFADFCGEWIYKVETVGTNKMVKPFATTGLGSVVDLTTDGNGALLYLTHSGTLGRITYTAG